jgi:hypothetical protein
MHTRRFAVNLLVLLVGLLLLQPWGALAWDFVWINQFGTSLVEFATGVAADSSGVYVAGSTAGALPGQSSAGGRDAYLRKYDFSGAELWTRLFGTPSFDGVGIGALATDATGIYVVCLFTSLSL